MSIEPDSPWENGLAESFHGRLRDEFLKDHTAKRPLPWAAALHP
jgi:transposase InsO family protein